METAPGAAGRYGGAIASTSRWEMVATRFLDQVADKALKVRASTVPVSAPERQADAPSTWARLLALLVGLALLSSLSCTK